MRGLYLNTQSADLPHSTAFFAAYNSKLQAQLGDNTLEIIYNSFEWPDKPPMVEVKGQTFYCAGWFIYRQRKNDLQLLVEDYLTHGPSILAKVELGIFVIARFDGEQIELINDKFGFSTHYIRRSKGRLEAAPGVLAFPQRSQPDPVLEQALAQQGHLFANYTIYSDITRLTPATCTTIDSESAPYWLPDCKHPDSNKINEVPADISSLGNYWPETSRSLAISGGLDSRLPLTMGMRFEFGYTYGPEHSGDRPIARLFADSFNRYKEYDFTAPPQQAQEKSICEEMFYGVSTYVERLLTAYKFSFDLADGANGFFDGFCGDVYQRGNFLKYRGLAGNFLRLFPVFYRLPLSAEHIMRKRYELLGEAQMTLLMADFKARTSLLTDADEYQKVTYYEQCFGRGARYVINGGMLTSGQMFTMIPFFFQSAVFDKLFAQDFGQTVEYRLLSKIWQDVPAKYSEVISDAGVGPKTPYWMIPARNIFYRAMVKFMPGHGTYVNEKPKDKPDKK